VSGITGKSLDRSIVNLVTQSAQSSTWIPTAHSAKARIVGTGV